LGVNTRNFLDGRDIPLSALLNDCVELAFHGFSLH
jgi:hypothetical protein